MKIRNSYSSAVHAGGRNPRCEHPTMRALKRALKYGPRMTRKERAEYVRQLLKANPKAPA